MLSLRFAKSASWCLLLAGFLLVTGQTAMAAGSTKAEIDAKVDSALARLKKEVPGSTTVLNEAKGVLVFAEVIKAGLVVAGEGGEGALRVGWQVRGLLHHLLGLRGLPGRRSEA